MGRCVREGFKIKTFNLDLCLESSDEDTPINVLLQKCKRETYQAQLFVLNDTRTDGFQIYTRHYRQKFYETCLTVDEERILAKECSNPDIKFQWRLQYRKDENGFFLYHVHSQLYASVANDGTLAIAQLCSVNDSSQRWAFHRYEGDDPASIEEFPFPSKFKWMFEPLEKSCKKSAKYSSGKL